MRRDMGKKGALNLGLVKEITFKLRDSLGLKENEIKNGFACFRRVVNIRKYLCEPIILTPIRAKRWISCILGSEVTSS